MNVIARVKQEPLRNTIRIVFISDTAGYTEYKVLLRQMEKLRKKPTAVFHGGDFVNDGTLKQYEKHLQITASSPFNVVHIPGNHDLLNRGKFIFKRLFGKTYFSFTYKDKVKFILINNADKKNLGNYGMDEEQFQWFELELEKDSPGIKIVLGHVPPNKMFRPYSNNIFFLMRPPLLKEQQFLDLMKKYNVGLYFCGHRHFASTLMDDDLRIVISGGGGQGAGIGGTVNTPFFTNRKHFTVLDIDYENMSYSGYVVKMGEDPNIKDPKLCFAGRFPHRKQRTDNKKLLQGVQGGGFLEKSPPGGRRQ
jgi:predicted phosphodiesterase